MNTEQASKNIFTNIKTHYGEVILAKIRKLKKNINQKFGSRKSRETFKKS